MGYNGLPRHHPRLHQKHFALTGKVMPVDFLRSQW